jgi:nucleoside-diphosphate-sugar epimerase
MNILITGALGHIGSKLIRYLPSQIKNSKFYLIDDLRTQRFISLMNLPKSSKFKFYDESLSKKLIKNLIKKIDVVIHLAATTDAASSIGQLEKVKMNNFENTKLISDFCASNNKKMIFISSTSVYGSSDEIMYEDDDNLNPQSPYADIKISEEKIY